MKKILLLICVILCLACLASCSHNHEKAENLLSDATHHWYPCADEDCDAVLEKVEHTWGEGVVTTKPTPSADGIRSYLCTVCQRLKQESVKYTAYHNVDVTQWKKAFSLNNFANVTATIEEVRNDSGIEYKTVYTVQADNSVIYVVSTSYQNGKENGYMGKLQDGNFIWNFTDKNQKLEDLSPEFTLEPMSGQAILTDHGFDRLAECYGSFTFDSKSGCYVASNLSFDSGFGYKSVSVEMQDGRVASVTAVTDEGTATEIKIVCSAYGTTKTTPPSGAEEQK